MNKNEFSILTLLISRNSSLSQRAISQQTGLSLGTVNSTLNKLRGKEWIDKDNNVLPAGKEALYPYKVDNAVIMAAGMSSRFAPLSYEKPKGLLVVKGEVLIERQIRQLLDAGITDIYVVVGYMKEKFFYLAEKFGVKIVINEDYYRYNNTSTLMPVVHELKNTYICSSDNYFTENVFEPYVYQAYYSAVYSDTFTNEYCLTTDSKGIITKVTIGDGPDVWYMLGHAYFDRAFSEKFREILVREYAENDKTKLELWENLYNRYLDVLKLYIRKYPDGVIQEFDSLDELRQFDDKYINNTDSQIFKNITSVLDCREEDIVNIVPIKSGQINTSFRFEVCGETYVYRHPNKKSEVFIHRESETAATEIAKKLGLDKTYIKMDPQTGWKISKYLHGCRSLDYHNDEDVTKALEKIRVLHQSKEKIDYQFDFWKQTNSLIEIISSNGRSDYSDFDSLHTLINKVHDMSACDLYEEVLCHCNFYSDNILIDENGEMNIIDWEYSGDGDPAYDIGTFISCADYNDEETDRVIKEYYSGAVNESEIRHMYAAIAISAYYWFIWAILQESKERPVGKMLYEWYRKAKLYGEKALDMYNSL
ncbi:MAG: phosphotransferase [Oscillospiraceae bacterium]|nr:phosphotransferase [Oscillospiraceae bacterium]